MSETMRNRAGEGAAMDTLQSSIGAWARATFPRQTAGAIIAHLLEETQEMDDARRARCGARERLRVEAADAAILLLALADREGFSLADAIAEKHAINRGRTWSEPDENGVHHHVRNTR